MIRGLILVMALAGPAMAEQPTERIATACFKLVLMWELDHPAYKNLEDMHEQLVEQCMRVYGFWLRTDNDYCTNENSKLGRICYERKPLR